MLLSGSQITQNSTHKCTFITASLELHFIPSGPSECLPDGRIDSYKVLTAFSSSEMKKKKKKKLNELLDIVDVLRIR